MTTMDDGKLQEAWRYAYRAALKTQRQHDYQEAEDAAQEAMLRLIQGRASGRDSAQPGWFGAVAHNYVLSQGRRKLVRQRNDRTLVGSQTCEPEHLANEDEEAYSTLVEYLLAAVPERYRSVAQVALVDGKSQNETAALLGIPLGTVMSRLFRARQALMAALNNVRCE